MTWQLEESVAQRPLRFLQFDRYAGCVAKAVGWVIPSGVGDESPIHELCARVIGKGVVVEDVLRAVPADSERKPRSLLIRGERELIGRHGFFLAAKADGLANEETRDVLVGIANTYLVSFRVGKGLDAEGIVQAEALPSQHVEVEFGAAPQTASGEEVQGDCLAGLAGGGQAIGTRVFG